MKNTSFTAPIIKLLVITTFILTAQTSYAQEVFVDVTTSKGSSLLEQQEGAIATFDIDADGDLDLVASGFDSSYQSTIYLYENDGSGTFTDITATKGSALVGQAAGDIASFDIDGDEDLDLVASGLDSSGPTIYLYENDGSGTFTDITATKGSALVEQERSALATFDIDADGDLDLVASGFDSSYQSTIYLYENDGSGTFTDITATKGSALVGQGNSALATFDIDGDGDLDLVASGRNTSNQSTITIYLYENDGLGTFTDVTASKGSALVEQSDGALEAFDIDGDGDLDLVTSGDDSSGGSIYLYENDGSGTFTDITATKGSEFNGVGYGDIEAFDIDGDGDLDLVTSGDDSSGGSIYLYENNGSGTFTDITATKGSALVGQAGKDLEAFDMDNDGDLDLIGNGYDNSYSNPTIYLYENITPIPEPEPESEPTRSKSRKRISQSRVAELFARAQNSEPVETTQEQETASQPISTESQPSNNTLCPAPLQITQNLRNGNRNSQVNLLQFHMNRILTDEYGNQAAGPIDGVFGPLTKRAVERLQNRLNERSPSMTALTIDGIVGPFTRNAINNSCSDGMFVN